MEVEKINDILHMVYCGSCDVVNIPDSDVEDGEELVGILENEKAMSIFSKIEEIRKKAKSYAGDMEKNVDDLTIGKTREIKDKLRQFNVSLEVLSTLFWVLVRQEFPKAYDYDTIGIRKDWQIVGFNRSHDISDLLSSVGIGIIKVPIS